MLIVGCDFHPSWQQVSWLDTETGETGDRKLVNASGEAKMFYQQLVGPVLIGMEATGNSQWKTGFRGCGRRTGNSATCDSWCCTGTSWWRFAAG